MQLGVPPGYGLIPTDSSSRVNFNKADVDDLVVAYGERFSWEKAAPCPCRGNLQTEQPNPTCPVCRGVGFEYYGAEPCQAVLERPDLSGRKFMAKEGDFWGGNVTLTVLSETNVGFMHRMTMLDGIIEYGEVRKREDEPPQLLRYPIAKRSQTYINLKTCEPRTFDYTVLRLTWFRTRTERVVMREGVDYQVTADGKIDWAYGDATGTAPPVGTTFSCVYLVHPPWVITTLSPYPMQNSWAFDLATTPTHLNLPVSLRAQLEWFTQSGGAR